MKTDIIIQDEGSVIFMVPKTRKGTEWIENHIKADNGFQPYYPTVFCEHRYTDTIIGGMQADGLSLSAV